MTLLLQHRMKVEALKMRYVVLYNIILYVCTTIVKVGEI